MDSFSPHFFFEKLFKEFHFDEKIRGRFAYNIPMNQQTWLQVGGEVGCIFYPKDWLDLQLFLSLFYKEEKENTLQQRGDILNMSFGFNIPLALGAGSNLLVRDGGMPQDILVKFGRGFHQIAFFDKNHCPNITDLQDIENSSHVLIPHQKETIVYFGAGLLDRFVAQFCQSHGLSGLEFLYTIPGTIGGGLFMNAGCFGSDFSTCLVGVLVMDRKGNIHYRSKESLHYGYRSCSLTPGWFFLGGYFLLTSQDPEIISKKMEYAVEQRNKTQPTHVRTGGSTFGNPPGYSAWSLIDQAGFRGKCLGNAEFSEKHCNFLINKGNASGKDLETLGNNAQKKILMEQNQWIEWEIVRWGKDKI